jgi:hypothetical protein
MSGFVMKGALAEYLPTFQSGQQPTVIVFQYNPETMTHTWTQPGPAGGAGTETGNPIAVSGMPGESFSFTISMDSGEDIADGLPQPAALAADSGLYNRLAALEMLMYPTTGGQSGLTGAVSAANQTGSSGGSSGPARAIPQSVMPLTLFIWGNGRIVPVRITGLTITEQLYDSSLNPTHVQAQVALRVLTPAELAALSAGNAVLGDLATNAYTYTLTLRQQLAAKNSANGSESTIGMVPH